MSRSTDGEKTTSGCDSAASFWRDPFTKETLLNTENGVSRYRVPRQSRLYHSTKQFNKGPWSDIEQRLFCEGLRLYGWGQWKEIGTILTTRYAQENFLVVYQFVSLTQAVHIIHQVQSTN
jgi:hypothetical protein